MAGLLFRHAGVVMRVLGLIVTLVLVVLIAFVWAVRLPHQMITWALGLVIQCLAAMVVWAEGR
ncbi:hypothetical protein [Cupriavidus campinensis]|uniref:hypothetical protein n=1 Tax=Cupriavidus campinensis TaxID=151783 RepID=UPI0011838127|nr:hypothetical protein [Cupriavidus campinensis]